MQDSGKELGIHKWQGTWDKKNMTPPCCPKQTDGVSCGVFMCCSTDCLSANVNIHRYLVYCARENEHWKCLGLRWCCVWLWSWCRLKELYWHWVHILLCEMTTLCGTTVSVKGTWKIWEKWFQTSSRPATWTTGKTKSECRRKRQPTCVLWDWVIRPGKISHHTHPLKVQSLIELV